MICAGIDPGSGTGVVVVDVPDSLDWRAARWIAGDTFWPSKAKHLTEVGRDRILSRKVSEMLCAENVAVVAIECAAEAKMAYRGQRRQQTDTAFRSGVYYQLAVTAAWEWGAKVTAYPAVTSKARGPGWMGKSHRAVIVPRLVALLRGVGAPPDAYALGPDGELRHHHVADALGVLAHHVNDTRLLQAAS